MLGGTIPADNDPGPGSSFTAQAAAATGNVLQGSSGASAPATPGSKPATSAKSVNLAGVRVLVADDAADNQMLLSLYLQKAGAEYEVVENGRQAVDRALSAVAPPLDLILMDMQMPEMDGYQATAHLRKSGYRGPVVAITAHAMSSDRDRCIAAGCDDFVSKPVDRAHLLALVARYAAKTAA